MTREETEELWKFWDKKIPEKSSISVRIINMLTYNEITSFDEVRAAGKSWFLQEYNFGKKSVDYLGEIIGGWPDEPDDINKIDGQLSLRKSEDLIKELRRRGYTVTKE